MRSVPGRVVQFIALFVGAYVLWIVLSSFVLSSTAARLLWIGSIFGTLDGWHRLHSRRSDGARRAPGEEHTHGSQPEEADGLP